MRQSRPIITMAALATAMAGVGASWAEAERVLIIAEDTGSVLVRTLASELAAGGFDVEIVSATVADDLSSEAGARHARAVLRVSPASAIDLWMADQPGSEVRFRERIESGPANEDASLLAIRAQEAVRGKLRPVAPLLPAEPPAPPREEPTPPLRPSRAPATPPLRFAASIGPSILGSPGGTSPMSGAALGFSWLASEHFIVEAMARIPVLAGHVDGPEGVANVGLAMAGAGVSFAFTPRDAVVRPSAGVGAAVGWTHVDGIANAPFLSHSADLFGAFPYASLATRLRLTSGLYLGAQVLGGPSLPPQAVTFAGRQVATFGEPVLDATLVLEAAWR
jgi:hypothetical protein